MIRNRSKNMLSHTSKASYQTIIPRELMIAVFLLIAIPLSAQAQFGGYQEYYQGYEEEYDEAWNEWSEYLEEGSSPIGPQDDVSPCQNTEGAMACHASVGTLRMGEDGVCYCDLPDGRSCDLESLIQGHCPPQPGPGPQPDSECAGTLQGLVTDANTGLPIEGAVIDADCQTACPTTGQDGIYSITSPIISLCPMTDYTVRCTATGYQPASAIVSTDSSRGDATCDFQLIPLSSPPPEPEQFSFTVVVTDPENNTVEGAEVMIDGDAQGTTGPDGSLTIQVTDGQHMVQASKQGYVPGEWTGVLDHNANTIIPITVVGTAFQDTGATEEIKFQGKVVSTAPHQDKYEKPNPDYAIVSVYDPVVSGPTPCTNQIKVITNDAWTGQEYGVSDSIVEGMIVDVYGKYVSDPQECYVTMDGSKNYYVNWIKWLAGDLKIDDSVDSEDMNMLDCMIASGFISESLRTDAQANYAAGGNAGRYIALLDDPAQGQCNTDIAGTIGINKEGRGWQIGDFDRDDCVTAYELFFVMHLICIGLGDFDLYFPTYGNYITGPDGLNAAELKCGSEPQTQPSLKITSIEPVEGTTLYQGTDVTFKVNVEYDLGSNDLGTIEVAADASSQGTSDDKFDIEDGGATTGSRTFVFSQIMGADWQACYVTANLYAAKSGQPISSSSLASDFKTYAVQPPKTGDLDGDGKVTEEEINEMIKGWKEDTIPLDKVVEAINNWEKDGMLRRSAAETEAQKKMFMEQLK